MFLDQDVEFQSPDIPVDSCYPVCPDPYAWPWESCPHCDGGSSTWWLDVVQPGAIRLWELNGAFDVTRQFDATARSWLLSESTVRLPAAEDDEQLRSRQITTRELVADLASGQILGTLQVTGSRIDARAFERAPLDEVEAARSDSGGMEGAPLRGKGIALTFSAVEQRLYRLARRSHQTTLSAWHEGAWAEIGLTGTRIGEPLALVYHLEQSALFAVDRRGLRERLLRIDTDTGRTVVLRELLTLGQQLTASLAVRPGGNLILAVGRPAPRLVRLSELDVAGRPVAVRWRPCRGMIEA